MKAEIAEASGIFFSADSTFSSDDTTSDPVSTAAVEFKGFLAITLKLQSRLKAYFENVISSKHEKFQPTMNNSRH